MRALALDTTTRQGSVALVDDDEAFERPGDPHRSHAERLPSELLAVLDARGVGLRDVDLFGVAAGPGSFTGIRIGIATVQGLAFVVDRPIVAVSTLEAVAECATATAKAGSLVGVLMDAQRDEVYSALYRCTAAERYVPERLVRVVEPSVGSVTAALSAWANAVDLRGTIFAGDAAEHSRPVVERAVGAPLDGIVSPRTLAATIARMAIARAARGLAVGPAAVRPEYIRRPDAELDRDRRATSPGA